MSDTFGINTPITWTCLKLPLLQGDDDIPVPQTILSSQASVETTERKINFNWTLKSCKLFFPTEHKRNFYIKRNCIGLNNFSFWKNKYLASGYLFRILQLDCWLGGKNEDRHNNWISTGNLISDMLSPDIVTSDNVFFFFANRESWSCKFFLSWFGFLKQKLLKDQGS